MWITLITLGLMIVGAGGYFAKGVYAQEMLDYRLSKIESDYITQKELDLKMTNINDKLVSIDKKLDLIDSRMKNENYVTQEDLKKLIEAYVKTQQK